MNVSATTLYSDTGTVGSATITNTGAIINSQITIINVSDQVNVNDSAMVKTELDGKTINEVRDRMLESNSGILTNIINLNMLDLLQDTNDSNLNSISNELDSIRNQEFPSASKNADLSNRTYVNEQVILDISDETYALENATSGYYPTDSDYIELNTYNQSNADRTQILSVRKCGLFDETLDTSYVSMDRGHDLSNSITHNDDIIEEARIGYDTVFGMASTIATQSNYDDLSQRVITITNDIIPFVNNSNIYNVNQVISRESVLSNRTGELGSDTSTLTTAMNIYDGIILENNLKYTIDNSSNVSIYEQSSGDTGNINVNGKVYINGDITEFRGVVDISDTPNDLNETLIDTTPYQTTRDVSELTIDFMSTSEYCPTHYVILDPSEVVVGGPTISLTPALYYQSDGGLNVNIRLSRLSKSRRIVVTAPPTTVARMSVTLYDDDTFTTKSDGYKLQSSDDRTVTMRNELTDYYKILTGNTLTGVSSYNVCQSILLSPCCVPNIDVSYLSINSTQKSNIVNELETDNRLQYYYNSMNSDAAAKNGGSITHLIRDVSNVALLGMGYSQTDISKMYFLGSMESGDSILNMNNNTMNGLPSFVSAQSYNVTDNGNQVDFVVGGASRLVYDVNETVPSSDPTEISTPFDYYSGNSYTFEINLVSTGNTEDRHLSKVYITEKTRQCTLPRFYNSRIINDIPFADRPVDPSGLGNTMTGEYLTGRFTDYRTLRKGIYSQLIANPSVI